MSDFFNLAVIGHPINHSLSPRMHQHWLEKYRMPGKYSAQETDGSEGDFRLLVDFLRAEGYVGCNVTIPHKHHAYKYCDVLSVEAEETAAVNTLHFRENKIFGYNTDIFGFLTNLQQHQNYEDVRRIRQALIIGAGSTTRSVLYGLLQQGFVNITIVNRTQQRAELLIQEFTTLFPNCFLSVAPLDALQACLDQQSAEGLVVNTTSIGMSAEEKWSIHFPKRFLITDVVYSPVMTPFLQCALDAGLPYQDGFGMLMHQGAEAFRLWTSVQPEVDGSLRKYLLKS